MTRRVPVVVGMLTLVFLSGLAVALPLAVAQAATPSTVVVKLTPGGGAPAGAPGYAPDNITVVIGVNNTVMWNNNDTVAGAGTSHTVTVKTQPTGGDWPTAGSGNIPVNKSYSFTFTVPGTYTYYCTYHVWMVGTVVVKASTPVPEFPTAALAVILFAVIAVAIVAAPRLMPSLSAGWARGTTRNALLETT